jgi:hypothetical protein
LREIRSSRSISRETREEATTSTPDSSNVLERLTSRIAELKSGDYSPSVEAILAYTERCLEDRNASSGLSLLPSEMYMPKPTSASKINRGMRTPFRPQNRTQRRRQHYQQVQLLYKRDRKQAAGVILDGSPLHVVQPDVEKVDEIFRSRFSRPSPPDDAEFISSPAGVLNMDYITAGEIQQCRDSMKKNNAPGPDRNITMDVLLALELPVLELLFNTWLALKQVPAAFKTARTILIPKSGDTSDPNNWRPITICSLISRLYAKLLASRLSKCANLSERQKAFRPVDGCGENTAILSAVIAQARKTKSQLHVVFLDLAKAFDTIPHTSIVRALKRKALPGHFIDVVENLYTEATTSISVGGKNTSSMPLTSGVKQGCPLSPILFNLVLDELITLIGDDNGVDLNDKKIAILAFADDLVLLSPTTDGMETNLKLCEGFFDKRSMKLNARKSVSLSIVRAHKRKTMLTDERPKWKVHGEFLPTIKHTEEIKYLGVRYSAAGRSIAKFPKLDQWLQRLKKAPLKPQQRIQMVRSTITSRLIHTLRLSRVHAKLLKDLDRKIRSFVKSVLHLPSGTSTDFFYIPVLKGGLGLQEFMTLIPAAKLKLINSMKKSSDQAVIAAMEVDHWLREERWCRKVTLNQGNKNDAERRRLARYINSPRGKSQVGFANLPGQCRWLEGGAKLTGHEYIVGCHLMSNTLPVRTRTFHGGRDRVVTCRYCPGVLETPSHALQSCPVVRNAVTKRHDLILTKLQHFLTPNYDSVIREPWFNGREGRMNPDLVLKQGKMVYVVDLTIPYDSSPEFIDSQAQRKVAKYDTLKPLLQQKFQAERVEVIGLALGARGMYTSAGIQTCLKLGLSDRQRRYMGMMALRLTCAVWGIFRSQPSGLFNKVPDTGTT